MHMNNAASMSQLIARLAEDVYHKRHDVVPVKKSDTTPAVIYLPYRISISESSSDMTVPTWDMDINFYVHVVIERNGRVWYTISDESEYNVDRADLMFDETDEDSDYMVRARSYRHYMFSDLLKPAVEAKIEQIEKTLAVPGQPYLWGTFPVVPY